MRTRETILAVALCAACWTSAGNAQVDVVVAPGDNLVRLLRANGADLPYGELLPLIEQTVRDNPHAFRNRDPARMVPGEVIRLPIAVAEPEPAPEPQPVVQAPEPEPAPEVQPPAGPLAAGDVEITIGSALVTVLGEERLVSGGSEFYAGDVVSTAPASHATLRFADGGTVDLGPSSRFRIDEYEAPGPSTPGRAFLSLLQGAMRALSGVIGQRADSVYRMSTPAATIGIRGTEYVARYCSGECGELTGTSVAVADGGVVLGNQAGELALAKGEFGRVESPDDEPFSAPLPEGFFDLDRDVTTIEVEGSWFRELLDTLGDWFN